MAEITGKGKAITPKVDLTPMVDLNLLLVTFFMFTSQLQASKAMEVTMPFHKTGNSMVSEEEVLHLYLSGHNTVRYVEGDLNTPGNTPVASSWEQQGIRNILHTKQVTLQTQIGKGILSPRTQLTVLIKPDSTCTTGHVVKALDEMRISAVPVYMITDAGTDEHLFTPQ